MRVVALTAEPRARSAVLTQVKARALYRCFLSCCIFARSIAMLDVVMLAIAVVSFALLIGYVYACDQL